jgi:hypothetical protein
MSGETSKECRMMGEPVRNMCPIAKILQMNNRSLADGSAVNSQQCNYVLSKYGTNRGAVTA